MSEEFIEVDYRNALDEFGDLLENERKIYFKYKDQIESGKFTKEGIENIVAYFKDMIEWDEEIIKNKIRDIYIAIFSIKYLCERYVDTYQVQQLIGCIHYLKNDLIFYNNYRYYKNGKKYGDDDMIKYDIDKLCKEVYIDLYENSVYGIEDKSDWDDFFIKVFGAIPPILKPYEERDEEFNPIHLLDLEWHFRNFKELGKSNVYMDKVLDILWLRIMILYVGGC